MLNLCRASGLGLIILGVAGCGPRLTDQVLLNYASSSYNKQLYDQPPKILGKLKGVDVIVEYKCSDICPMYTVRVIRFDLPAGMSCDEAGGQYTYFDLPPFSQQPDGGYCAPIILTDNWGKYIK